MKRCLCRRWTAGGVRAKTGWEILSGRCWLRKCIAAVAVITDAADSGGSVDFSQRHSKKAGVIKEPEAFVTLEWL